MEENKVEPIQDEQSIAIGDELPLNNVLIGMSGKIIRVEGEGKIKRRLFDMGLTSGAEVFLRKKAPLGDPLEITLRGYELTLRKDEASHVVLRITDLMAKDPIKEKEGKAGK